MAPVSFLSRPPVRLFLTATSLLFVELLLIRWIPANVIYVGYFRNFLLMASFLGIGVGILWGRDPKRVPLSPFGPLLLGLVVLVTQFRVSIELDSPGRDLLRAQREQGRRHQLPGPARARRDRDDDHGRAGGAARGPAPRDAAAKAYSVDIAGSMTGIALFTLLSATGTPPIVWFTVVAILISLLGLGVGLSRGSLVTAGSLAAVLVIVGLGMPAGQVWSPYYRIDQYDSHGISGHQRQRHPAPGDVAAHRDVDPFYEQVYRWFPERTYDNVLIVGAGSGTDVAVALKHGAKHVDAVEIDPRDPGDRRPRPPEPAVRRSAGHPHQ